MTVWVRRHILIGEALGFQNIALELPALLPFLQPPHTKPSSCTQRVKSVAMHVALARSQVCARFPNMGKSPAL